VSGQSPAEVSAQRRAAAHSSWAKTPDRAARMSAAWAGQWEGFLRRADPDGVMEPAAREAAAEQLRKAHYAEITRRSLASRRARAAEAQST